VREPLYPLGTWTNVVGFRGFLSHDKLRMLGEHKGATLRTIELYIDSDKAFRT
jgi:hypothetical protein